MNYVGDFFDGMDRRAHYFKKNAKKYHMLLISRSSPPEAYQMYYGIVSEEWYFDIFLDK